jgi:hypothetical protein
MVVHGGMVVEDREACSSVGSSGNGVGVFVHCIPVSGFQFPRCCVEPGQFKQLALGSCTLVEPGAVSSGGP